MYWLLGLLATAGGLIALYQMRKRREITYPAPETHIIQLEDDLSHRVLHVDGVANFRDMGGYTTQDGQRVKPGRVYRSGKLDKITPAGLEKLHALGIRLVCDMRSPDEVADAPDSLPATMPVVQTTVHAEQDRQAQVRALLFNRERLQTLLPELYTTVIIDQNATVFGQIIRYLADANNLPTLIHCTAGKDRTGVAGALLLSLLGVPDETVIADYTLSNLYYDNFYAITERMVSKYALLGVRTRQLIPLLTARADTMRITLDYVREHYGSVERYIREQAGVDDATRQRLRDNLLEPA